MADTELELAKTAGSPAFFAPELCSEDFAATARTAEMLGRMMQPTVRSEDVDVTTPRSPIDALQQLSLHMGGNNADTAANGRESPLLGTDENSLGRVSFLESRRQSENQLTDSAPRTAVSEMSPSESGSPDGKGLFYFEPSSATPSPEKDHPTPKTSVSPTDAVATSVDSRPPTVLVAAEPAPSPSPRRPVGKAIDVWALGVTLYCMVYGRLPFEAVNEYELFSIIPFVPVSFPVDTVRGDLAVSEPALVDLLGKLLEKDPMARITLRRKEARRHDTVISSQLTTHWQRTHP